jgi:transcription elongation factor Elf1
MDLLREAGKEAKHAIRDITQMPKPHENIVTAGGHTVSAAVLFCLGMSEKVLGQIVDDIFSQPKQKPVSPSQTLAHQKERFKNVKLKMTDRELELAKYGPDEPRPFTEPKEGERSWEYDCGHAYCEGNKKFTFSEGQRDHYYKIGISYPKACYPCRKWVWTVMSQPTHQGNCETCNGDVWINSQTLVHYHRNTGIPQWNLWCKVCKEKEAEERRLTIKEKQAYSTGSDFVDESKMIRDSQEKKYPNRDKRREQSVLVIPEMNERFDGELVELTFLNEYPDTRCFYHNKTIRDGIGGWHSVYDHIEVHVKGRQTGDDKTSKQKFLEDFKSAKRVIEYAHSLIYQFDPDPLTLNYRGWYEDKGHTSYVKIDCKEGIKFVFSFDHTSEKWYLKTAFRSDDPESNAKLEIGVKMLLKGADSQRRKR